MLARAGHLLGLVFAPRLLSPEPLGDPSGLDVALGALALLGPLVIAVVLLRRYPLLEAKIAAGVWVLASIALYIGADPPPHTPLLASYYTTAPFVWTALALTAAALAGEHLGSSFKNKKMGAGLIVIAIGIFIYRDAHKLVGSPTDQWLDVLRRDPANAAAFHEVRPALAADATKFDAALTACLTRDPGACHCRVERASSLVLARRPQDAIAELRRSSCSPDDARAIRVKATAAVVTLRAVRPGDAAGLRAAIADAEAVVGPALEKYPDDATLLGAKAALLNASGRPAEALELVRRAIDGGAGHDAKLLLAQLLIGAGDLDGAEPVLKQLALDSPDDADVVYDLGLIADHHNQYNQAREAYLKALKLDSKQANARYNLAVLTNRYGFADEAKSHARRFRETFPQDPRGAELAVLTGLSP
ncbi:MAG: tetratricopeptide repeat protein [Polyangiaceae bacterium]|nr:tetratricopeptide repeat protein [Polyangiaceae bacterium]